jgi:predicted amidohydrolase YtcJ
VHREIPIDRIHWFFDHAETVSEHNMARIARLGGGIAIQHRMAYQGEDFIARYGVAAAGQSPPFKRMLEMGIRVGAGTDATRVASYDPWTVLYWLTAGKTLGGATLYEADRCLSRAEALALYTRANTWFSNEGGIKGQLMQGQLADLAILSEDFLSVDDERIRGIESVLTVCNGEVVHASSPFAKFDPPPLPVLPDWSPVAHGSRYWKSQPIATATAHPCRLHGHAHRASSLTEAPHYASDFWGALGCSCWAF